MNKQAWTSKAVAARRALRGLPGRVAGCVSVCIALLMVAVTLPVQAQVQGTNSIQAVTGSVQGGFEIIRIDLAEPLSAVPTGFSIQTPARIALDFPGIGNSMGAYGR